LVQRWSVTDFSAPEAGAGDVLLKFDPSEVSFPDIVDVKDRYQGKISLPFVPRLGEAGRAMPVGGGVKARLVGTRVLALIDPRAPSEQLAAPTDCCFEISEGLQVLMLLPPDWPIRPHGSR
jgi:NADPH2:quinone reductase